MDIRPPLRDRHWQRRQVALRRQRARLWPHWTVDAANGLFELLYPPTCGMCGNSGDSMPGVDPSGLCERCRSALLANADQRICRFCGLPCTRWHQPKCPACHGRRFRFQQVVSLGVYRGVLRCAAIRMKSAHEYPLTVAVGHLLADQMIGPQGLPSSAIPEVVVPLPKFWMKRFVRGTSTSELLAQVLGRRFRLPVALGALRCRRNTRKQSLLGIQDRQRNVRGAFQVARGYDFHGADVLLVDDIMTTGATASDASRGLRQRGARRVVVAVAARAIVGGADVAD